jgi:cbb3-type cytochrome oxidase subunit 3
MKLADVVSAMHWTLFAEIALVIAASGFAVVLAAAFAARNREPFRRASRLPLEDDPTSAPSEAGR